MQIILHPQRRDDLLVLSRSGDTLAINGEVFDFAELPNGGLLPSMAIESDFFCGPVQRLSGELVINLILPHGPNPSEVEALPGPIAMADGQTLVLRGQKPEIVEEGE